MKKSFNVLFVVLLSLFATSAFAEGFYFSAGGGLVTKQDVEEKEFISQVVTPGQPANDAGPPATVTTPINTVTDILEEKISFDKGFAGYAAIGKRFGKYFRAELEYAYKNTDVDEVEEILTNSDLNQSQVVTNPGTPDETTELLFVDETIVQTSASFDPEADLGIHTIMLNGFLDYDNSTMVTPFVGFGVGTAIVNLEAGSIDESDTTFAWQGMGGASVEITKSLSAQAFYRYLNVPGANILNESYDIDSHSVEMGIVYTF